MDLSIVILNYNTRDHLRACLESIADEGSTARWPERERAKCWWSTTPRATVRPRWWRPSFPCPGLIRSPYNGGYAMGNNPGLGASRQKAILLLNPDSLSPRGGIAQRPARPPILRPVSSGPRFLRPTVSSGSCRRRRNPERRQGDAMLAVRAQQPRADDAGLRMGGRSEQLRHAAVGGWVSGLSSRIALPRRAPGLGCCPWRTRRCTASE